jgi:hypothetical protein
MESRRQTRQARAFFRPTPGAGRGIGPQGARSAFSGCCSQSEPIFPVGNLPAQHKAAQPNRHHLCHAGPLHATPRSEVLRVTSLARAVSRRSPQRYPPLVYSVRRRFSAPAHSTQEARLMCGVSAGHWRFSAPGSSRDWRLDVGRPRGRRFWIWRGRDRPAVAAVASQ